MLLLPLVDGRMRGSSLITRPKLAELWNSFARDVARPAGLNAPPRRMSPEIRLQAARLVLDRLATTHAEILQSPIWAVVRRSLARRHATEDCRRDPRDGGGTADEF